MPVDTLADRCQQPSTSSGTGNLTLDTPATGYRAFSTVYADGEDKLHYVIEGLDSNGDLTGEWEAGRGELASGGTVLQRNLVFSSSTGGTVNFTSASLRVMSALSAAALDEWVITRPIFTATDKGLAPASGAPSGNFLKDDGTWATPAGTGEANLGANVGSGADVFRDKIGVTLNFRGLNPASSKISAVVNVDNIDIDVVEANINHDSLSGFVANEHIDWTQAAAGTIHTDNYIEGGPGTDTTAIHDNVSGEINAITEKVTPVSGDWLLIEDSAATNAKKKIQIGNLPGGGGGTPGGADTQMQYNNGGAFGGAAQFHYDDIAHRVGLYNSTPSHILDITPGTLGNLEKAFNITASLYDSGGTQEGARMAFTPTNNVSTHQRGLHLRMELAPASFAGGSTAGFFLNQASSDGTTLITGLAGNQTGNIGVEGFVSMEGSRDGTSAGVVGYARYSHARNYGVAGVAAGLFGSAGVQIGVYGTVGTNGSTTLNGQDGIAGLFTLYGETDTINNITATTAALIADNASVDESIFIARHNGVDVLRIENTGALTTERDVFSEHKFQVSSNNAADRARVGTWRSRGTIASPTNVTIDDFLGDFSFVGRHTTNWNVGARIAAYANEDWNSVSTHGTYLVFETIPNGTSSAVERLRFDNGVTIFNDPGVSHDVQMKATSKSHMFYADSSAGRILMTDVNGPTISAALPAAQLHIHTEQASTANGLIISRTGADGANDQPRLSLVRALGTTAVPTAVGDDDILGTIFFAGQYSGVVGQAEDGVQLVGRAAEAFTASFRGSDFEVWTATIGAAEPTLKATLTDAGDWLPGTTAVQDLGSASLEWGNLFLNDAIRLADSSDPTSVANTGFLYGKADGLRSELHWIDDNSQVVQFTKNGNNAAEVFTATSRMTLTAKELVSIIDNGMGTAGVFNSLMTSDTTRANPVGIAMTGATAGNEEIIKHSGEETIPDALWDTAPVQVDMGKLVYASSATAGKYTITKPSTTNHVAKVVGVVSFADGGTNTTKIVLQSGSREVIP